MESWADLYEDEHLGSDHIEDDQPVEPRLFPRPLAEEQREAFQQFPDADDELLQRPPHELHRICQERPRHPPSPSGGQDPAQVL